MTTKPADIDAYLSTLPDDTHATLAQLRRTIKALVPDAVESISYDMPTLKYKGRPLAYFGAWKNHCAMYGVNLDAHKADLAGYDIVKGTLRFPHDEPLPEALVEKLIRQRMADIEAYLAERRGKKAAKSS